MDDGLSLEEDVLEEMGEAILGDILPANWTQCLEGVVMVCHGYKKWEERWKERVETQESEGGKKEVGDGRSG